MKKIYTNFIFILIFVASTGAQQKINSPSGGWKFTEPFSSRCFIENNGQFSGRLTEKTIYYAIENGEMHVYFTKNGPVYHLNKFELKDNSKHGKHEERELAEEEFHKHGDVDPEKMKYLYNNLSSFVAVQFLNANPDATIEVDEKTNDYYTYSLPKSQHGTWQDVKANAYRRLVYKNIYPNIDIEYFFPENKSEEGFKYNIVIRPGGKISDIKISYDGHSGIQLNDEGALIINTPSTPYTEHAPVSFINGNELNKLKTRYIINKNVLSFEVDGKYTNSMLVIDPWITNPGFTTNNNGYGIRVDYQGNCYVYGGGVGGFGSNGTFQLKKFNNAGVLQWTFTTPTASMGYYGDVTVDRPGNSFIGAGFGFQGVGNIIKLNTGGTQVAAMQAFTPNAQGLPGGSGNSFEQWRVSYNQGTNATEIIIGGGGTAGFQMGKVDLNLTAGSRIAYNSFNSNKGLKDVVYTAQDPNGQFAYATLAANSLSTSNGVTTPGDPEDWRLVKVSTGVMQPNQWQVRDTSAFQEVNNADYLNGGGKSNGLNGLVPCHGNYVYAHNGAILRAWDKANGALSFRVNSGGQFDKFSGIDVDSCCRVYIGVNNVVKRYSSTLVFDQSFNAGGDVYDLKINPLNDKQIYVTGKGFVQLIEIQSCPTCINTVPVNASGCTLGSATVTVNDPNATAPYSYTWSTNPVQTTQTATGLSPGTYIVTVYDATKCNKYIDTVTITGTPGNINVYTTVVNPTCASPSGSVVLDSISGATSPFSIYENPNTIATNVTLPYTIGNVTPGSHTYLIVDAANCSTTVTVNVNAGAVPQLTLSNITNITCFGASNGSVNSNVTGGTPGYIYTWSPSGQTTSNATGLGPGIHVITMTDSAGCTITDSVTITEPPALSINTSATTTTCGATNGSVTATVSGGTPGITYSWIPGGGTGATVSNLGAGIYVVIATDQNGCTIVDSVTVQNSNGPTATTAVNSNVSCNGGSDGSATVTTSGGTTPYTYTWTPGNINTPNASNLTAGTYTVIVADASGCTFSQTITITQPTALSGTTVSVSANCTAADGSATITATGGTSGYTYSWNNGQSTATATGLTGGSTYSVTVTDANGCTFQQTVAVSSQNNFNANVSPTPSVTIVKGDSVPLVVSGGTSFTWSPSTGLSCTNCPNPVATPASTTTYIVSVTDSSGCTDTDTVTVIVDIPCYTNLLDKLIPTAFSPNGDGKNDILCVPDNACIKSFFLRVYDRWGEKVFETDNLDTCWEGYVNGKAINTAVFIYIFTAELVNGDIFSQEGTISLIR